MEIKELDKKQLILLTLLITFVVSIATGIVTVSLMNQAPKSVPQTINNIIQKTIEKVTTEKIIEEQVVTNENKSTFTKNDLVISIYKKDEVKKAEEIINTDNITNSNENIILNKELGQGVLISDNGLILVDSNILQDFTSLYVILNKQNFDTSILKKFNNGFSILKILDKSEKKVEDTSKTTNKTNTNL